MTDIDISNGVNRGYCELAQAILDRAEKDINKNSYREDAEYFLKTDWAYNLSVLAAMVNEFTQIDPRLQIHGLTI